MQSWHRWHFEILSAIDSMEIELEIELRSAEFCAAEFCSVKFVSIEFCTIEFWISAGSASSVKTGFSPENDFGM